MSNHSDEHEQQQQQHIPSMMNMYSYQPPQNSQFTNNNVYYGGAYNNEPPAYYQQQTQQQQLFNPYHQHPQQIFTAQPTLQQFNDPVVPTEPDEFITDLLKKPQERLFLLKLELELEAFIREESKFRLDFPNMNSYQRLMIHRLAPYYKLNHFHDAMRRGVYVCKTFITELPSVRLQDIQLDATNTDNDDTIETSTNTIGGSSTPQFKIMRRDPGSSGSSPRSGTNNNDGDEQAKFDRKNMSYEERKTAYEEARARIFQS